MHYSAYASMASTGLELVRPQRLEPRDAHRRQRALGERLERLLELLDPGDPEHPGREVPVAEDEAQGGLRRRAVGIAERGAHRRGATRLVAEIGVGRHH